MESVDPGDLAEKDREAEELAKKEDARAKESAGPVRPSQLCAASAAAFAAAAAERVDRLADGLSEQLQEQVRTVEEIHEIAERIGELRIDASKVAQHVLLWCNVADTLDHLSPIVERLHRARKDGFSASGKRAAPWRARIPASRRGRKRALSDRGADAVAREPEERSDAKQQEEQKAREDRHAKALEALERRFASEVCWWPWNVLSMWWRPPARERRRAAAAAAAELSEIRILVKVVRDVAAKRAQELALDAPAPERDAARDGADEAEAETS